MVKPIEVKAFPNHRLWLRFDDGSEGQVDLSEFAGKGVFQFWNDYKNFERVKVGEHGAIEWGDDLDMCGDALYLRLTGKTPEDVFPNLREISVHA